MSGTASDRIGVERFAEEAANFRQWALQGTDQGAVAAREALVQITRLYLAALELPPPWSPELENGLASPRVEVAEWKAVYAASERLPLQYYTEIVNPLPIPPKDPEEPVIADLADDIADIYRDVVTGLRLYESGQPEEAVWEWGFHFRCHWGEHATGAIRALHCWLAANADDLLGRDGQPIR